MDQTAAVLALFGVMLSIFLGFIIALYFKIGGKLNNMDGKMNQLCNNQIGFRFILNKMYPAEVELLIPNPSSFDKFNTKRFSNSDKVTKDKDN